MCSSSLDLTFIFSLFYLVSLREDELPIFALYGLLDNELRLSGEQLSSSDIKRLASSLDNLGPSSSRFALPGEALS